MNIIYSTFTMCTWNRSWNKVIAADLTVKPPKQPKILYLKHKQNVNIDLKTFKKG